jgi:2-polyprenyl-3-methyl-5-hydroxy-6-metoxy-1,4-benzoquinol methylase
VVTNYDDIADDYLKAAVHPIKKYCEAFTLLTVLGNVEAKSILDLACGDGYYTRLLKQQGAAQVVGVDISRKMIAHAKQTERDAPLGIDYQTGDISKLGQIGQFDVITAVYLFPYAATRQLLAAMFQTIYHNLKAGGKLVSITLDPNLAEADLAVFNGYGLTLVAEAGLQDGTMLTATVTIADGNSFKMETFHWKEATYESIIYQIGFQKIRWHPIQVSAAGLQEYGAAYWQAYETKPYSIVLECDK